MTPKETVLAFYTAYGAGDVEAALALFDPAVRHTALANNTEARFCGLFDGVDAVRARVATLAEHWTVDRFVPEVVVADGDRVAAMALVQATERHTGGRISMHAAHFFTVRDGWIVELDELFDSAMTEAALPQESV